MRPSKTNAQPEEWITGWVSLADSGVSRSKLELRPTEALCQLEVTSGPRCLKLSATRVSSCCDRGLPSRFQMPEIPLILVECQGKSNVNIGESVPPESAAVREDSSLPLKH